MDRELGKKEDMTKEESDSNSELSQKIDNIGFYIRIGNYIGLAGSFLYGLAFIILAFFQLSVTPDQQNEAIENFIVGGIVIILEIGFFILIEIIVRAFKNREAWAFTAIKWISVLYLFGGPNIIFGVLSLIELYKKEVKSIYGK